MLPGIDAETDDGRLAQRLGGLQPVQPFDQHEARAVRPHQDWRLLAVREHALRDLVDARLHGRRAPLGRHVDIGDREVLALHHGEASLARLCLVLRPSWQRAIMLRFGAAKGRKAMYLSGESILIILFVGLVAGWLAGKIVQGTGFGLIGDIAIGIVGAFIASWLFPRLGFALGTGMVREILDATIGAVLLLVIIRLVRRGGRW